MELSIDNFKLLMRSWPTGVAVISSLDKDGMKYGFTANSFTSVSLDPLLVSFCLRNNSSIISVFKEYKNFAVSILSNKQADLASHFAQYSKDKFHNIEHEIGEKTGCAIIKNSVGFLECTTKFEYEGGDHTIFVGEVRSLAYDNTRLPLIYRSQSYASCGDVDPKAP